MPLLNPGDPFPRLTITTTGGQTLALPDAFAGDFGVVLFYRGAWCPYCNAQLRAFERASAGAGGRRHPRRRPVGRRRGDHRRAGRKARADLPRRLRRGRAGGRRAHRRLRQPRPGVPAVHRLRARPGRARSSSACTQAAPSGGSSPTTSSASSATCASTRPPRRHDETGDGSMTRRRHPLLLRPGVPVRLDDEQVGAHGRRAAGLRRRLAVHLAADDQLRDRLRQPLPRRLRGGAHLRAAAAAGRGAGAGRARPGRRRAVLRGGQQRDLRLPRRRRR